MPFVTFDSDKLFFRPGGYYQTIEQAQKEASQNGWKIHSVRKSLPDSRRKDGSGFEPHYNHGLGEYVNDKGHYKRLLREKNLIEVGNERVGPQNTKQTSYKSEKIIDAIKQAGASVSDGEAKEILASV